MAQVCRFGADYLGEGRMNDGTEKVIKHLEMIQAVVNRMGNNSFLLKGWSMTLVVAVPVLIAKYDIKNPCIILSIVFPVLGFWVLDGYFLWQERLFRKVYDEIRVKPDTDFKMNPMKHKNEPKCSWPSSIFSVTLCIFYLIEILFILMVFGLTHWGQQA